jgi:hypothetical protein
MHGAKLTDARQDFGKDASAAGHVQHNQNGRMEIGRQLSHDRADCFTPPADAPMTMMS